MMVMLMVVVLLHGFTQWTRFCGWWYHDWATWLTGLVYTRFPVRWKFEFSVRTLASWIVCSLPSQQAKGLLFPLRRVWVTCSDLVLLLGMLILEFHFFDQWMHISSYMPILCNFLWFGSHSFSKSEVTDLLEKRKQMRKEKSQEIYRIWAWSWWYWPTRSSIQWEPCSGTAMAGKSLESFGILVDKLAGLLLGSAWSCCENPKHWRTSAAK